MERNKAVCLQSRLAMFGLAFLVSCLPQHADSRHGSAVAALGEDDVSGIGHVVQAQRGISTHDPNKRLHARQSVGIADSRRHSGGHHFFAYTRVLSCLRPR